MTQKLNDVAAVVATRDFSAARSWYSRLIGREPDLEPIDRVAEWQITATAWLQLIEDSDRAGRSAVRLGVDSVAAQVAELTEMSIGTREPVVVAGVVAVLDITDPDGNEVSFVEDLSAE